MIVLTVAGEKHWEFEKRCNVPKDIQHWFIKDNGSGKHHWLNTAISCFKDNAIVALLDADDIATPEMFNPKRLKYLEEYDLIYGDYERFGAKTGVYKSREFDRELFKSENFIPYSTIITKAWLLKKELYPDEGKCSDWIYLHKLLKHTDKFKYVPGIVCKYDTSNSYFTSNIPVWRKIKRLTENWIAKQKIKIS